MIIRSIINPETLPLERFSSERQHYREGILNRIPFFFDFLEYTYYLGLMDGIIYK